MKVFDLKILHQKQVRTSEIKNPSQLMFQQKSKNRSSLLKNLHSECIALSHPFLLKNLSEHLKFPETSIPDVKRIKKIHKAQARDQPPPLANLTITTIDPSFSLECDDPSFGYMASPVEINHSTSVFFPQKDHMEIERSTALVTSASKMAHFKPVVGETGEMSVIMSDSSAMCASMSANKNRFSLEHIDQLLQNLSQNRFLPDIQKESFNALQTEINEKMRAVLINWMLSIFSKIGLKAQTFFIAIQLLDSYCARKQVDRKNFQKLGITCLFIAAKFEEILPPKLAEVIKICDGLYTRDAIIDMESEILRSSSFSISPYTLYSYTEIFSFKIGVPKNIVKICTALLISSLFDLRSTEFDFEKLTRSCLFLAFKIVQQLFVSNPPTGGFPSKEYQEAVQTFEDFQENLLKNIMAGEFDFKCVKFITYLVKNLEKARMFAIRKLFSAFGSHH